MSIEVTQADRDAAAAYYYSAGGSPNIAKDIREGRKDGWFRVQAFARHRQQAEARKDAEIQQAVAAEVAQIVAWLGGASVWLNGGECCGQKCSDGVCCAPACLWGEELKLLHSVADAIERGEYKETSGDYND